MHADHPARPRLLMLTHRLPYPPDRGDRIRSYHLLRTLSQHATIDLACVSEEQPNPPHIEHLRTLCRQVAVQRIGWLTSRARGVRGLLRGRAVTPSVFFDPRLMATIHQWQTQQPYDAVLTFCTGMSAYTALLPPDPQRRQVLDLVDVDSVKWSQYAAAAPFWKGWLYRTEAQRLRTLEADAQHTHAAVTVVSQREADVYRQTHGDNARLQVVGNGVDLDYFQPLPQPGAADALNLAFIGVLDYPPNRDGIIWFAREIFPAVRVLLPKAKLRIVGRHAPAAVVALGQLPGVKVVGAVDDVRAELARAAAVIAPLQIARGVQNKVLEAMACARVVIATPQAAAGVEATPGRELLMAAQRSDWPRLIASVLDQPGYRAKLASHARALVETKYTWSAQLAPLRELLWGASAEQIAQPRRQAA